MNGSVDDTGKPLARASSDASHVRIIALAGRRADHLRVTPTGAQGRLHHAAGVRPLVARLVHGTGCRFARRRATACNPAATSAEICGVEKRGKSLRCNGEPGGNRTPNPQIKSLLLCQLSYRPAERFIVSQCRDDGPGCAARFLLLTFKFQLGYASIPSRSVALAQRRFPECCARAGAP